MEYNHITIIISTRNAGPYIEKCITTALEQDYPNFDVIFLDAESTDGTYEKALQFKESTNITVERNKKRKYQGENIRDGVLRAPNNSIIITLDGDDWFPHKGVLNKVNEVYNSTGCWMTYGTYEEYPYRSVSHIYQEYPLEVRRSNSFRKHRWLGTHLRTFRRELFLNIKEEDLKDPRTGDYVAYAPDQTFQYPMLEMCGVDKSVYIPDILYVYNVENPNNESKQDTIEIEWITNHFRSRDPYKPLEKI